jgi:putative endonuclease
MTITLENIRNNQNPDSYQLGRAQVPIIIGGAFLKDFTAMFAFFYLLTVIEYSSPINLFCPKKMNLVYILHSTKLNRFTLVILDFDVRLDYHLNYESRKFTHNASDWITFLKLNANLKIGFTNRKANQEYEKQVYIQNLKEIS